MTRHEGYTIFDNRAAVAGSDTILSDWKLRSEDLRTRRRAQLDLGYGLGVRQRIDFFPGEVSDAPLVAFVHGGYWQRNSKDDFAFIAEGPLAHGFAVAVVGYTLAPVASIGDMIDEITQAIGWLRRTFTVPICLVGWSAGAHLVASVIDQPGLVGGIAISGIYDLEPLRRTSLNEKLGLDASTTALWSPIRFVPRCASPLLVAYGGAELPELQRQSQEYWRVWKGAGLPGALRVMDGRHHFSALEELAQPGGELSGALAEIIAGSR